MDGVTCNFFLDHGATWHDGEPGTAHDWSFMFDALLAEKGPSPMRSTVLRMLAAHHAAGFPIQAREVSAVPGLSLLGLFWMYSRGSSTLFGVGKDAEHVANHIAARMDARATISVSLAS